MNSNIFRNIVNGTSVSVNFERLKGLGQNIIKKHDDETQEDIKDTQPETQTVSSEQASAWLGIHKKGNNDREDQDEISKQESWNDVYNDMEEEKALEESWNDIYNDMEEEKVLEESWNDIYNDMEEEKVLEESWNDICNDMEETTEKTSQTVKPEIKNVEAAESESDEVDEVGEVAQMASQQPTEQPVEQYAQEKICCENEREIQLGQVLSPLTLTLTPTPTQTPTATAIAKTEKALCEQIRALTPAVFKGTILPQDSQKLLKLLGLDINQTFQTNENGEILTKDGVKTGVGSNFDNNDKLVNFCTLNRGDDEKLPVLRNLKNSLCNLDISGSLQSDEKTRRSRFIIEIKNGCFYLKSENDFIYINMPVYLGADGMFDNFGEAQQCNLRYDSQNQYKPKTPDEQAPKTVTISTTNEYKQAYKQAFITNTLSYERTHFECRSFKDDTSELVENSIRTFKSLTHNLADKEKIRCQFKLMKNYYVNNNYKAQTDPEGLLDKCFWLYTYNQYKKDKPYDNEAKQNLARMQQNPSYYITNLNNKFDAAYASNNIDEMLKIAKELIEYYQHALEIMQSLSPEVSSNVANSYQQIKEQTNLPKE